MELAEIQTDVSPEFSYHLLRNALDSFGKNSAQLDPAEYKQVYAKAVKSYQLESLVLSSAEAEGLIIADQQLDHSVAEVASRYPNAREFEADLEANGLDQEGLRRALYRELVFDAVMQRVSANAPDVNELDVELYYEMNYERFQSPELRVASQILITVNPDFPENTQAAALERMQQLVAKLGERSNRFKEFVGKYSECPTAMDGGKLGDVRPGQLYPELDTVLFNLQEQQISPIIETEMGFHILLCEKIKPGKRSPLSKVAPRIREMMAQRNQRNCQKAWLANLQKTLHA